MTFHASLSDLDLAALISSKICHDVINPVGAIYNGLEVLDDNADEEARAYALSVIRNFTAMASAKLEFARLAYGAAGSAGSEIDLTQAERLARGFLCDGKHHLNWQTPRGLMAKDRVKLLLNLVAIAITSLPRGGEIEVTASQPLSNPIITVRCRGHLARMPQHLPEFITNGTPKTLDAMSIQAYYACRLAEASNMVLETRMDGDEAVIIARPRG